MFLAGRRRLRERSEREVRRLDAGLALVLREIRDAFGPEQLFVDPRAPGPRARLAGEQRDERVGEDVGLAPDLGPAEPEVDGCVALDCGRGPEGVSGDVVLG